MKIQSVIILNVILHACIANKNFVYFAKIPARGVNPVVWNVSLEVSANYVKNTNA